MLRLEYKQKREIPNGKKMQLLSFLYCRTCYAGYLTIQLTQDRTQVFKLMLTNPIAMACI